METGFTVHHLVLGRSTSDLGLGVKAHETTASISDHFLARQILLNRPVRLENIRKQVIGWRWYGFDLRL